MKKFIFILAFAAFSFQFAAAQNQAAVKQEEKVQWSEKAHDYGQIPQGVPAKATFTFKNNSNEPVVITNVRSSCGCTVAGYTKEPVRPGEEGEVSATYNAARPGKFSKSVTVTMGGDIGAVLLTIKGEVTAKPTEQTQ